MRLGKACYVPFGELHLFDTGHFALDECAPQMAPRVGTFLERVAGGHSSVSTDLTEAN